MPTAAVTKAKALASELPALSWLEVPRDFPEKGPFFADRASHRIRGGRSQGKQDVIARAIFRAIGAQNRRFVEIGFNENEQCVGSGSNTCQLWLDGWTGLLLDAAHSNASIGLHSETLDSRNVASVLRKHSVPTQVDFLSIDVDSVDILPDESTTHHARRNAVRPYPVPGYALSPKPCSCRPYPWPYPLPSLAFTFTRFYPHSPLPSLAFTFTRFYPHSLLPSLPFTLTRLCPLPSALSTLRTLPPPAPPPITL